MQVFQDQMTVNNINIKEDGSKAVKKFDIILKDIKNTGRTTKPKSVKICDKILSCTHW